MTTSTAAAKVTTAIPAVNTAWRVFVKENAKIDGDVRTALRSLAGVISAQTAPATSVQKSIEATGQKASAIGYGTVKALPTWLALDTKHGKAKDWKALTIKEQLTLAAKSYSLLGKGKGEQASTYADLVNLTNDAQAEKTRKAKEANAKPDTGKDVKPKSDLTATLKAIYLMVSSLSEGEIKDSHVEQFNEIAAVFEQKSLVEA